MKLTSDTDWPYPSRSTAPRPVIEALPAVWPW